jgi:hypothetical protein
MVNRLVFGLVITGLLLPYPSAQAKPSCNNPAEISAVQVRQLQIEMMVSTLRCDSTDYDFRHHYGEFVTKINPLLPDNLKRLKTMLGRQHKGDFDRYMTSMSNDAQNISQQDPQYCPKAVQILDYVVASDLKDFPSYAATAIPSPYQVTPCPDKPAPKAAKKHKVAATQ